MRILFDHGTPAPFVPFLEGHTVIKAKDAGWDKLANGDLLKAAEDAGFDLLLTTDKNMAAQQNFGFIVQYSNAQLSLARQADTI
jgi:hypothetical protein